MHYHSLFCNIAEFQKKFVINTQNIHTFLTNCTKNIIIPCRRFSRI